MPIKRSQDTNPEQEEKRLFLEDKRNLEAFIKYVQPRRVIGNLHRDLIRFWNKPDALSHQLVLLPRDHGKSAYLAFRITQALTRDPTLRILLISSTSNLATKQLKFIKDIMTSDNYRLMWPEMIEREEAKREKWTEREFSVDHPLRKEWSIRDPSIFTAGMTTNVVGLHCDRAALDDVVVAGNAYTEEGREKVLEQYSLLSSVESVNAEEWTVGTRYYPTDLYNHQQEIVIDEYDEFGSVCNKRQLYEVFERQVESLGDGTGEFIWPRQQGPDGKWFGFDRDILAVKKSQYQSNPLHFRAQYYNDPHDVDSSPIKREFFQYYEPQFLNRRDGKWYFQGERLNVVAAVDFAYSLGRKSDSTSIAVVGVDGRNNYYVLEVDRFKTDKMKDYFDRILKLYEKWGFRKIRAEVTAAQQAIVTDLKESYIRPLGLALAVEEYRPMRGMGSKDERIRAILEARYVNRQMWHYAGGNCQTLEDELTFANPAHDDVKDAVSMAVDLAVPPSNLLSFRKDNAPLFTYHSKFGGVT